MVEGDKKDIILMAILALTSDDVLAGANELGIPEEQVTDDVIEVVREEVGQGFRDWWEVIKGMIKEAIKKEAIKCPLGMVCSPSCAWRGVGKCVLPTGVEQELKILNLFLPNTRYKKRQPYKAGVFKFRGGGGGGPISVSPKMMSILRKWRALAVVFK